MSVMASVLRRGLARAAGAATTTRLLRGVSGASRRCLCAAAADSEGDDESPVYARRPMKTVFAEYDAEFNAKLAALEAEKRESLLDWDYVAAPFLERPMVIYPDPDPAEVEYSRVRDLIDEKYMVPFDGFLEGQAQYDETVMEAEKLVAEQEARVAAGEEVDEEKLRNEIYIKYAGSETGDRIIEQYDLLTRKDNPRRTQADHDDDRRSLNRKLDEPLFLVLKKDREEHAWQFPKAVHVDAKARTNKGPTPGLRETAEKAQAAAAGKALTGYYYSNAPQGFYYYKYPEGSAAAARAFGAKVFFYRVRYLKGKVKPVGDYVDYNWVTKSELEEYVDADTYAFLRQML